MMSGNAALTKEGLERVPEPEIQTRIEKFQGVLESKDLDGAFLLQNIDIYYFTGTLQRSILYIPREGRALLMVIKSFQRAREESPLSEILPLQNREGVFSLLADFGHGPLRRVGLELDVLPAAQYLWFRQKLPETGLVDISPGIRKIRMIKSPYEVNQIRRATAILDKGYREIGGLIREGMTELEIDGLLSYIARREGHMGFMRMRGWNQEMNYAHVLSGESGATVSFCDTPVGGLGNTPAVAQGAGFRRIRKNEPIYIDYGSGVNGYLSDQTRTFVIGRLADHLARAHACSIEILQKLESDVRPGMPCGRLFEVAETIARDQGVEPHFMGYGEGKVKFLGHGFGLEIDEYPIITPGSAQILQEGMVFALEPKFVFPGEGAVGIEDDYLVTAAGLARLTLTEQALIRIPE
jgi:Xaa-Pro aminopeptidase